MHRIMIAAMLAGVLGLQGCASIYTVGKHNEAARQKAALRVAPLGANGAALEIDLLADSTGYWAAWQESPAAMATATAIDGATAYLAALGISELYDSLHETPAPDAPKPEEKAVPTVQTSGATTIVIAGDGNTVQVSPQAEPAAETAPAE